MKAPDEPSSRPPRTLTAQDLLLLGRRIAQRRRSKGWKQNYLALQSAIEPGRLSRLEQGKARPQLLELINLRTVLGGTIDELVFGPEPLSSERLGQLLREIESLATGEQIQMVGEVLQLLTFGLRSAATDGKETPC